MATIAVDDVPLLVRVLAGNPVTAASVISCLDTADTRALRRLHYAVAVVVASVPWADTATRVVDVVRWRAALPGAVGVKLTMDLSVSEGVVAALAGVTRLDMYGCNNLTDEMLLRLPTSLRTLNVRGCYNPRARAGIAHLTALVSLDCSCLEVVDAGGLPPSLQELTVPGTNSSIGNSFLAYTNGTLAHLTQLRVLRAARSDLHAATLASLSPGLKELHIERCQRLTAGVSFAHLRALRTLQAAGSTLCDAAVTTLPRSLVSLNVRRCGNLTSAAMLPPLPALRRLNVSGTRVGDALVSSLPAALEELRLVQCRRVTAGATLDHVPSLRALCSLGTALDPAAVAACHARGCVVLSAGVLREHRVSVAALAVLADGRLASADANGEVRVWGAAAERGAAALLQTSGEVRAMAALPDGCRLAVGIYDYVTGGSVEVWDLVSTGTFPVRAKSIPCSSTVHALVALADGRLAAGCRDGSVRVVDVDAGAVVAVLEGHSGHLTALAVLPDGALAAGSYGGNVRLWDVERNVRVAKLVGRNGGVLSLAVLANGRLACGAAGGVVRLWDVGSRTCVGTLIGHSDAVTALAALPDGRLVSGSDEGIIQLWDTRPAAVAAVTAGSRPASVVHMTELAQTTYGTSALVPLPDGRLACACEYTSEVFLLELPPPATYEE